MLKKTIKFKDYNDVEREADYFFDLNETDLVELQIDTIGGFHEKIDRVTKMNDEREIYYLFKKIIKKAYGEKADDGIHFDKSEAAWERFITSPAYNTLMLEFMNDPQKIVSFIEGLMPKMTDEQAKTYNEKKKEVIEKFTGGNNVQH